MGTKQEEYRRKKPIIIGGRVTGYVYSVGYSDGTEEVIKEGER